jgi:hypothetical protein
LLKGIDGDRLERRRVMGEVRGEFAGHLAEGFAGLAQVRHTNGMVKVVESSQASFNPKLMVRFFLGLTVGESLEKPFGELGLLGGG